MDLSSGRGPGFWRLTFRASHEPNNRIEGLAKGLRGSARKVNRCPLASRAALKGAGWDRAIGDLVIRHCDKADLS